MITPSYSATATERVLPLLALDFTTGVLDPRVTVTRALNTATRINSSGYVEGVNANLPRFDYDPVTLAPKGLLIEETRANLLTYSSDYTNAVWTKTSFGLGSIPVVTPNFAVSPDGTNNASRVQMSLNGGTTTGDQSNLSQAIIYAAGAHTFSVWLRSNTGVNQTVIITNVNVQSSVLTVTTAWQRFTWTVTSAGGLSSVAIRLRGTFTGNTADILVYGAQLEAGAFATSYIPTTTTSLTRNADVVSMTGTNFSNWFNASAGTVVANFSVLAVDTSKRRYAWFVNETGLNRLTLRALDSTINYPIAAIGTGASVISLNGSAITANTTVKIAVAYGANLALSQNGAAPATNASASSVTGSSLFIGCGGGGTGNELCGHVQKMYFYPQRLLNAETQAFSK